FQNQVSLVLGRPVPFLQISFVIDHQASFSFQSTHVPSILHLFSFRGFPQQFPQLPFVFFARLFLLSPQLFYIDAHVVVQMCAILVSFLFAAVRQPVRHHVLHHNLIRPVFWHSQGQQSYFQHCWIPHLYIPLHVG